MIEQIACPAPLKCSIVGCGDTMALFLRAARRLPGSPDGICGTIQGLGQGPGEGMLMRAGWILLIVAAATALGACGKSAAPAAAGNHMPPRKAGLWIQTMIRDGHAGRWGEVRMCVDAQTDSELSMVGRALGRGPCERTVTRDTGGVYHFRSTCKLGENGIVSSSGTASGDFVSGYQVHTENDVAGAPFPPLNGHHITEVTGRYAGPCPAGLAPGDITFSSLKMNLNRLPLAQHALGLQ